MMDKMKQISFKTNCGFLESKLNTVFYGSNHKFPDEKVKKFLDDNWDKPVKVTLTVQEKSE